MMNAPLPGTWWVRDGVFLAGGFPGDADVPTAIAKLRCLLNAGVRCFISLQQPGEMDWYAPATPYVKIVKTLAEEMGVNVVCHNFPIVDMDVPDEPLMRDILDAIKAAVQEEQCVYVHCWGGHGRTGTVVGCWLREHGFSGEEALRRIRRLRRHDPHLMEWDSPQTKAQRDMILTWNASDKSVEQ
ncbi:MAG TPA: hypothetical protein ENN29_01035 [Candidatus Hydrogenedentes bacterium]|nr:hypothetical protein [Candidatus Hydrogenedentota bacterium]